MMLESIRLLLEVNNITSKLEMQVEKGVELRWQCGVLWHSLGYQYSPKEV